MRNISSSPNVTPLHATKRRQVLYSTSQLRDCLSSQFTRLSTDSRTLFTNHVRTCIKLLSRCCYCSALPSHNPNVSFKLIRKNFIRMLNVFKSDAVIWWAAIFRTSSLLSTPLLLTFFPSLSPLPPFSLLSPLAILLTFLLPFFFSLLLFSFVFFSFLLSPSSPNPKPSAGPPLLRWTHKMLLFFFPLQRQFFILFSLFCWSFH